MRGGTVPRSLAFTQFAESENRRSDFLPVLLPLKVLNGNQWFLRGLNFTLYLTIE